MRRNPRRRKFSDTSLQFEIHSAMTYGLPYIQIKNPPIKLLIDTGSGVSLLHPQIIQKYYPNCLRKDPVIIKTCTGQKVIPLQASIPKFNEFNQDGNLNVIAHDFHNFFDGLLGYDDLKKMNFNINISEKILENGHTRIPLYIKQRDAIKIQPRTCQLQQVPVNCIDGDVIIKRHVQNETVIPETLTTVKNGMALIEIQNSSDQIAEVVLTPFQATPVSEFDIFNFSVQEHEHLDSLQNLIRTNHMNREEKNSIITLCKKYLDIFHKPGDTLTFTNEVKHEIKTKDQTPVYVKSYRYPYVHKEEVRNQISKMLDENIIRPSQSPWSSPIWIVPKKMDASGKQKWRIVVDYRKVNEKTVEDRYPLPNIEDILDKLGRSQYFSTLDLASGFHQIEMHPESIQKTAFNVENGHYEYLRMPFGLKNAPATFQRVMDSVLKGLQNKICLVYMDDIIIFSASLEEHIKNLKTVFDRLRASKLKIQLDKCEFLRKEVEFLGHIVTPDGVKPNPKKIEAIKRFPIPKTAKEIKSFLGLLGYYRKFIKNFAKITKPLTKCLKKDEKVTHTPEFVDTFEKCKTLLCNDPILTYPDFSKTFELTTDASNFAVGAILSQEGHPICYASRTLNPAEINYPTIQKEMLAIVWACKNFRPYLFGRKFIIYTDHKPLTWLANIKEPNSRLVRWRLKLSEFEYEIQHKKGKTNQADPLSRIKIPQEEIFANETESLAVEEDTTNLEERLKEVSEAENETIHSDAGEVQAIIPISEKPLNMAKKQFIFDITNNILQPVVRTVKVFDKDRTYITFHAFVTEKMITKTLKEHLSPNAINTLYFRKKPLDQLIIATIQKNFNSISAVIATQFLDDVEKPEEQQEKIKYYHEGKSAHRGISEVYSSLKRLYYWPNMEKDVTTYINNCEICQTAKYERHPQTQLLEETYTPEKPFEQLHMDLLFMENRSLLTIIDQFSKYGQAYILGDKNGTTIVNTLIRYTSHHGLPQKIIVDQGPEFKNKVLSEFCQLHKIKLHFTSTGNSKSNGAVERFHSTLTELIRSQNILGQTNFETKLYTAILGYNNSIHSATKHTPFEVINGHYNPRLPFDINEAKITQAFVKERAQRIELINEQIKRNIQEQKRNVCDKRNKNRTNVEEVRESDQVYIKNTRQKYGKTKPKFVSQKIKKVNQRTIVTDKNKKYSKDMIKKKRKYTKKPLLQDEADPGPSTSANQPLSTTDDHSQGNQELPVPSQPRNSQNNK